MFGKRKIGFFIFLVWFGSLQVRSQIYVVGQDPSSVKWKSLSTESFKIIYPEKYGKSAEKYLMALSVSHRATETTYFTNFKAKRLDLVLHPFSTLANAMVSPVPLHADFFTIPDQSLYPQRWSYQLALHEYRHFVQMRKMYQGVGKGLYYVFGQMGPAALFGAFVPFWFIEGDAVMNETLHSKSGRGRLPAFWVDLKAQLLEKGAFPYDKAVLGSYRDYVPDHYTLGYQMVWYGLSRYGGGVWDLALEKTAKRPYTFKPFVSALKSYSGKNKVQFYRMVVEQLKKDWMLEQQKRRCSQVDLKAYTVENKRAFFTDYRFPQLLSDGSVIAEKMSLDDVHRFVRIWPDGKEKTLFTPGFDPAQSLSANDSLICWSEKVYDIRWSNRDFSVIKLYHFKTKKLKQLTRHSRYFSPVLSPDSKLVAAVSVSDSGIYSLELLDAETGNVLKVLNFDENYFILTPSWSKDGQKIVAVVLGDQGKNLLLYHPYQDRWEWLLPWTFTEINRPSISNNKVFFTGTWGGANDLYELDLESKEVFSVFKPRYGAEDVILSDDHRLVFAHYTVAGYRIVSTRYNNLVKEKTDIKNPHFYPVDRLVNKKTFVLEDTVLSLPAHEKKKYSKVKHLFHVHSWGPLLFDINTFEMVPNAVIMSQNMLGTSVSTLGYYYDVNEKKGRVKWTFDYTGLFPVIGMDVQYGGRQKKLSDDAGNSIKVEWTETDLNLNFSVPLKWINGKWIKGIRPSVSVGQKFLNMSRTSGVEFKEDHYNIFSYGFFTYHFFKRSRLDLLSKWSQSLSVYFRQTAFSDSPSNLALVSGTFTFPGLVKHHGFKVYLGRQWKKEGNYPFSDMVLVPRGYHDLAFKDAFGLRTDYVFPIAYPDWDIPSFVYLTRLYAHLFYDFSHLEQKTQWIDHSSVGVELYTNWHFLSLPIEFTLGFRGSYLKSGKFEPQFLFSFGY